jgi:hypothetical protein
VKCFTDYKGDQHVLLWRDRDGVKASMTHEMPSRLRSGEAISSPQIHSHLPPTFSRPVHLILLTSLKGSEVRTTLFGHVHDIKRHASSIKYRHRIQPFGTSVLIIGRTGRTRHVALTCTRRPDAYNNCPLQGHMIDWQTLSVGR